MMLMLRLPSACARRAALALLAAAAALPAARANVGTCLNATTLSDPSVTQIDFSNATLVNNTLHEAGGELRLDGVATINDNPISLVVTDASANKTYPDITDAWNTPYEDYNGLTGNLTRINLQAVKNKAGSGKGIFKFCLVDTATGVPTKAEKFVFTMYDMDQRGSNPVKKERALFRTQSATAFQLYPNSYVKVDCEFDTVSPPCGTVRTRFTSSSSGMDNPSDPDNLTPKQLKGAIAVTFDNTDCFEFEYELYCPTNLNKCESGGNFLFGGMAESLVVNGECIAIDVVPTNAPTDAPVVTTGNPTTLPPVTPTTPPPVVTTGNPTTLPPVTPPTPPPVVTTGNPTTPPPVTPPAPTGPPTGCVPKFVRSGNCTKPLTFDKCGDVASKLDHNWISNPININRKDKPFNHIPGGCFAKENRNGEVIKMRYNSHGDAGTNCGGVTKAGKFTKVCVCCE